MAATWLSWRWQPASGSRFSSDEFYFRRLLDGGPLILTNGGIQIPHLAYRRDVAAGYIAAMNSAKAVNQVYNFAQNRLFRMVDWVRLAADLLDVEADIVSIPAELLQQSGFVYSENWILTGTYILDVSRAQADFGYTSTPVETWMATTTAWYREQGDWTNSLEYSIRDTVALIERQVGEPVVLAGFSMGAAVALGVAARLPGLVRALILLEPPLCYYRDSGLQSFPELDEWLTWLYQTLTPTRSFEEVVVRCKDRAPDNDAAATRSLAQQVYSLDVGHGVIWGPAGQASLEQVAKFLELL